MSQNWSIVVFDTEVGSFLVNVASTENDFLKTTVKQLKQKIYDTKSNVEPPEIMRLVFNAKPLEELHPSTGKEHTLQDYGIKKGSTVHIVRRLRGGGGPLYVKPLVPQNFPDSDTTSTKPHAQVVSFHALYYNLPTISLLYK